MNEFTARLHKKGYKVTEFIAYWNISRKTYERMTGNSERHDKLLKMIKGLPDEQRENARRGS